MFEVFLFFECGILLESGTNNKDKGFVLMAEYVKPGVSKWSTPLI